MTVELILQIILYVLAVVLAIWAASPPGPRGRRWSIIFLSWACFVAGFALVPALFAAGR